MHVCSLLYKVSLLRIFSTIVKVLHQWPLSCILSIHINLGVMIRMCAILILDVVVPIKRVFIPVISKSNWSIEIWRHLKWFQTSVRTLTIISIIVGWTYADKWEWTIHTGSTILTPENTTCLIEILPIHCNLVQQMGAVNCYINECQTHWQSYPKAKTRVPMTQENEP